MPEFEEISGFKAGCGLAMADSDGDGPSKTGGEEILDMAWRVWDTVRYIYRRWPESEDEPGSDEHAVTESEELALLEEVQKDSPFPLSISPIPEDLTEAVNELNNQTQRFLDYLRSYTPDDSDKNKPKKEKTSDDQGIKTDVQLQKEFKIKSKFKYGISQELHDLLTEVTKGDPISYNITYSVLGSESGFKPSAISPTGVKGMAQMTKPTLYQTLYWNKHLLPKKYRDIVEANIEEYNATPKAERAKLLHRITKARPAVKGTDKVKARDAVKAGSAAEIEKLRKVPVIELIVAREHMRSSTIDGKKRFKEIIEGKIKQLHYLHDVQKNILPTARVRALEDERDRKFTAVDVKTIYVSGATGGANLLAVFAEPNSQNHRARDYTDKGVADSNPWVFQDRNRTKGLKYFYGSVEKYLSKHPLRRNQRTPKKTEERRFRATIKEKIESIEKAHAKAKNAYDKQKSSKSKEFNDASSKGEKSPQLKKIKLLSHRMTVLKKELARPLTESDAKVFDICGEKDGARLLVDLVDPGAKEDLKATSYVNIKNLPKHAELLYEARTVKELHDYIEDKVGNEPLPDDLRRPAALDASLNNYLSSKPSEFGHG